MNISGINQAIKPEKESNGFIKNENNSKGNSVFSDLLTPSVIQKNGETNVQEDLMKLGKRMEGRELTTIKYSKLQTISLNRGKIDNDLSENGQPLEEGGNLVDGLFNLLIDIANNYLNEGNGEEINSSISTSDEGIKVNDLIQSLENIFVGIEQLLGQLPNKELTETPGVGLEVGKELGDLKDSLSAVLTDLQSIKESPFLTNNEEVSTGIERRINPTIINDLSEKVLSILQNIKSLETSSNIIRNVENEVISQLNSLKENLASALSLLEKKDGSNSSNQIEVEYLHLFKEGSNGLMLDPSKEPMVYEKALINKKVESRNVNENAKNPYIDENSLEHQLKNKDVLFDSKIRSLTSEKIGVSQDKSINQEISTEVKVESAQSVKEMTELGKIMTRDGKIPEMNLSELKQKMSEKIEHLQKLFVAKDRILVQINPKNLGTVDLYFKKEGNRIQLSIELEHQDTKHKVDALMDDLRKEFKDRNIEISYSFKERENNEKEQQQERQRKNENETLERKEKEESFEEMIKETIGGLKNE